MPSADERWLRLQPIKIGWLGIEWSGFKREIRMAFDDEGTFLAAQLDHVQDVGAYPTPSPGQAAFAVGLRAKGETAAELAALVRTMLAFAEHVDLDDVDGPIVDTCGTGGYCVPWYYQTWYASWDDGTGCGHGHQHHGSRLPDGVAR